MTCNVACYDLVSGNSMLQQTILQNYKACLTGSIKYKYTQSSYHHGRSTGLKVWGPAADLASQKKDHTVHTTC